MQKSPDDSGGMLRLYICLYYLILLSRLFIYFMIWSSFVFASLILQRNNEWYRRKFGCISSLMIDINIRSINFGCPKTPFRLLLEDLQLLGQVVRGKSPRDWIQELKPHRVLALESMGFYHMVKPWKPTTKISTKMLQPVVMPG